MAQDSKKVIETAGILDMGVKLGYLTPEQVESVGSLQRQMRRAGISLPIGQTLLERKYITLDQLKNLRYELARRTPETKTPDAPSAKSKKFGQYEILKILSEKDRARVFKARDTLMNRIVVLKVLPRSMASDAQWSERFRREIQLAGKLVHPNIATVFGAGEVDGNPLMAIEFVEGMSLGERLEREGNLPKMAWRVAKEVAKGLAFATENGVFHRDVKPDNVLCGVDGKIKLIDLGLSKAQGDTSGLTMDGTTVGTPFYISPEQARGTKTLDCRSDLYSLGCTVFHMLTGSVPFFHEEFIEVMQRQAQAPRPDPRDILPEITEGSALLVMRMMAINPNDRPETFEHLIEEIDQLLELLPEPIAEVRPVAPVASSDAELTDRRNEFWVPPAPPAAPASKPPAPVNPAVASVGQRKTKTAFSQPVVGGKGVSPERAERGRAPTEMDRPVPKSSAFSGSTEESEPAPPPSFMDRIKAWFGKLFK